MVKPKEQKNNIKMAYCIELEGPDKDRFLKYITLTIKKQPAEFKKYISVKSGDEVHFTLARGEYDWVEGGQVFRIVYAEEGEAQSGGGGGGCSKLGYFTRLSVFHDDIAVLKNFITQAQLYVDEIEDNKVSVYTSSSKGYWSLNDNTCAQPLSSIYLMDSTKRDVVGAIDHFMLPETKARFIRYGRKQKLSFLFTGVPGAGKSSLAIALARKYKRRLYVLNISKTLSDEPLADLVSEIKSDSILLIEDVDCYFQDRKAVDVNIGFSCFLNILDGCLAANNGLITIMTANNAQAIDPALLRPGRSDRFIKFEYPVMNQVKMAFEDLVGKEANFAEFYERIRGVRISMAGIVDYLFNHPVDYLECVGDLLQNTQIAADIANDGDKGMYT